MTKLFLMIPALLASTAAFAGAGGGNGTGVAVNLPEPASLAVLAVGVAAVLRFRNGRRK